MSDYALGQTKYRPLSGDDRASGDCSTDSALGAIYADKFCSVSPVGLTIYWLHVWKRSSTFAIADLVSVEPANSLFPRDAHGFGLLGMRALKVKMWGLGGTGILWALALSRAKVLISFDDNALDNDFVVTLRHWSTFRAAFTVEDPLKFKEALNQVRAMLELGPL